MTRWQHLIWVGAVAVLAGCWTTPALAQNRQAGAKTFNQQGGGMCQQGNVSGQGSGVNAAAATRASRGQNSSSQSIGTQTSNQQMIQAQIAMMQQYMAQLAATQQLTQAQMAMMNQYLAQLTALQQQMGQNGNNTTSTGQTTAANTSVNANAALTRRTAAR
jgi:hypothetical protein